MTNYFSKANPMDRVHGRCTTVGTHGPLWTGGGADRRTLGCRSVLTGVWPPATPKHGSSPTMAQKRDESAGNPAQASPELRRQCGGLVMVMKRRHREDLAAVVFELGGRGKVEGWVRGEPAGGRGGLLLSYWLEGGWGGDGRVAMVSLKAIDTLMAGGFI
jgi:hypothetical protein